MTLTPLEKEQKKQRKNLLIFCNRVESAFNFKEITSWEDLSKWTSVGDKTGPLTFPELKDFLNGLKQDLENKLSNNEPSAPPKKPDRLPSHDGTVEVVSGTKILPTQRLQVVEENPTKSAGTEDHISDATKSTLEEPTKTNALITELDKDYGWNRSPNVSEDYFAFWFQKKAEAEIERLLMTEDKKAALLIATTGTGKTFMSADVIRHMMDVGFHEGKTYSHVPYVNITRSTVVEQTSRVFNNFFNVTVEDCDVINIEQLRSKYGRLWLKKEKTIISGEEVEYWKWKEKINPFFIVWDECQALKNDSSTQHEIAAAFSNLKASTKQLFVSATPFTRVSEARCFAVATNKLIDHLGFPKGTRLTNETWPAYAAAIASPAKPFEYNEAACDRLMEDLKDFVVRVKGVRPQFDGINGTEKIRFKTQAEADYYHQAWDRYVKELARFEARRMAEGSGGEFGGTNQLVAFLKFRMAAEYCRRHELAERADKCMKSGKAAVLAVNFKATIIAVTKILIEDYGYTRDDISLVWGGGQNTKLTKEQEEKNKIKAKAKQLEAMGMTLEEAYEAVGLEDVEDKIIEELDPSLKLGPQTKEDRQIEIDKFQSGRSICCMFTFRAGGVGLSLHHSDEYTTKWDETKPGFHDFKLKIDEWNLKVEKHNKKVDEWVYSDAVPVKPSKERIVKPGKVRRKESGYAYEEDIPFIPVRPRECFLAPTYSGIELVQGLGRCPRLTSLSHTKQTLLFYAGTIEDDVAAIVARKLKCLSHVVRMKESWEDVVKRHDNRTELTQKHIDAVPAEDSGESVSMIELDNDEQEIQE